MLVAEILVILLNVIALIVVTGLGASAYFKMQETDRAATRAVAGEKRRLGLAQTDTLPRASSFLPNAA